MQKRIKKINVISLIIFLSFFSKILSQLNETNSSSMEIYNKCLSKYELIIKSLNKIEIKMENIKFNIKLKIQFRNIKELNETMSIKISELQKKIDDKNSDIKKINEEINILNKDMNFLDRKTSKFIKKYNSYDKFKSDILNDIKIFFIIFFTIVIILLIILIIVGIYINKNKKYFLLHEEITISQEQDKKSFGKITDVPGIKNVVVFNQGDKSSGRDLKVDITPKTKDIIYFIFCFQPQLKLAFCKEGIIFRLFIIKLLHFVLKNIKIDIIFFIIYEIEFRQVECI